MFDSLRNGNSVATNDNSRNNDVDRTYITWVAVYCARDLIIAADQIIYILGTVDMCVRFPELRSIYT